VYSACAGGLNAVGRAPIRRAPPFSALAESSGERHEGNWKQDGDRGERERLAEARVLPRRHRSARDDAGRHDRADEEERRQEHERERDQGQLPEGQLAALAELADPRLLAEYVGDPAVRPPRGADATTALDVRKPEEGEDIGLARPQLAETDRAEAPYAAGVVADRNDEGPEVEGDPPR
jgi:hypothetical protein